MWAQSKALSSLAEAGSAQHLHPLSKKLQGYQHRQKYQKNTKYQFGPISIFGFLPHLYPDWLFGLNSDRFCAPEDIIEMSNASFLFTSSAKTCFEHLRSEA